MASIRKQVRLRFAITLSLLLVTCSTVIWLWASYLASRHVRTLLLADAQRLADAIVWNADLEAFELHSVGGNLNRGVVCKYWRVLDASGLVIWQNASFPPGSDKTVPTQPSDSLFTTTDPAASQKLFTLADDFTRPRRTSKRSMVEDFPAVVMQTARSVAEDGRILATELEFEDNHLVYEVTVRRGDELINFDMNEQGVIIERSDHRVPTSLPAPVLEALAKDSPGAGVTSFDWRASQGHLEFLLRLTTPQGQLRRRCVSSTGQIIPLYFPTTHEDSEPVTFRAVVADPQTWRSELLYRLGLLLTAVCSGGVAATMLLSEWLTRRTLKPIARIAGEAGHIDDRRLSERLTADQPDDEFGQLIRAINSMLNRIETAFERQRRFARDASHELRGPLTGLIAHLELARGSLGDDHPASKSMGLAVERSQRLRDLVEKLLLLARQDSDQPLNLREDVNLAECLVHVIDDFSGQDQQRITLKIEGSLADDAFVHANEELLHSMFRNIIENALKFSPAATPIRASLGAERGGWVVAVCDQGPGIPPDVRGTVFEPFIRLKGDAATEGSGLGLSIVHWIARIHNASIRIESGEEGGTRFIIWLPNADQ